MLSFIRNFGKGKFDGQFTLDVNGHPSSINLVPGAKKLSIFSTQTKENTVDYIVIDNNSFVSQSTIHTAVNPEIVWSEYEKQSSLVSCIVQSYLPYSSGKSSLSLSRFEEIAPLQFTELSLAFPGREPNLGFLEIGRAHV